MFGIGAYLYELKERRKQLEYSILELDKSCDYKREKLKYPYYSQRYIELLKVIREIGRIEMLGEEITVIPF